MTSGSGGDRPPISDTAMAFPINGQDFVEPLWVARCFDSVYSVAITEKAVYIGGHFNLTSRRPRTSRGRVRTMSDTARGRGSRATDLATR